MLSWPPSGSGVPVEDVEQLDVSDAVSTLKSDPSKRVTYAELIDGKGDVPAAVEFGRVAAAPVNTLKGRGKNNYQVFVVIHLLQG